MNTQNLYHLEPGTIDKFNVVVEIPMGSQNKYEIDSETGAIFLDRVLYGSVFYPVNYGFIPSTKAEDGDAADALVFSTNPVPPGVVIKCRAIGIIKMVDSGEMDSKILCVPTVDPRFDDTNDISDLPQHKIKDLVDFFKNMQKHKKGEWITPNQIQSVEGKDSAISELKKYL
jgi:inorganic pyrophosphatase